MKYNIIDLFQIFIRDLLIIRLIINHKKLKKIHKYNNQSQILKKDL